MHSRAPEGVVGRYNSLLFRTALSCLQGQTGLTVKVAAEENEVCERYWEVVRSCRKVCRLSGSQ